MSETTQTGMIIPRALPKKITELGRIRIGDREENKSGNGTHPRKLEFFRFTSSNKPLLHAAANMYGGEVVPWEGEGAQAGQFELYSTVNAIDVLIPTASAISISYEQWRAGGCTVRCTGEKISHSPLKESLIGAACTCPADDHERASLAKDGKACARILRLNVILPDLPGMGLWRLETKGFYATAELIGSLEMLQMSQHQIVEAALRLEQRTVKRFQNGKSTPFQFAVPVLWPKFTPRQMLAAADRSVLLMHPPEQKALPPAEALKALAADLYGDDRTIPNMAQPSSRTAPPQTEMHGVEHDAIPPQKTGGQSFIDELTALMEQHGETPDAIQAYWHAACQHFKVSSPIAIPRSQLPKMLIKKRKQYEDQAAERAAWAANETPPEPDDIPEPQPQADWRAELTTLLNVVKGNDTLLSAMFDVVDDAETPDTVGLEVLGQARAWVAEHMTETVEN